MTATISSAADFTAEVWARYDAAPAGAVDAADVVEDRTTDLVEQLDTLVASHPYLAELLLPVRIAADEASAAADRCVIVARREELTRIANDLAAEKAN